MKTIPKFLIFYSSIFIILFTVPAQSANLCEPDSCDPSQGPPVRFPFRLKGRQPARCGYSPDFDLYCDARNQTIINLPESGEFVVDYINYRSQSIYIADPHSCLPNRGLNFSLSGSPFRGSDMSSFVIFNCSAGWRDYTSSNDYVPLLCLSGVNYTVVAASSGSAAARWPPQRCRRVTDVSVPLVWTFSRSPWWSPDFKQDFGLEWSQPACRRCENQGGVCGFKGDSGSEIGCSGRSGLPRSAKYAIMIGVGIPGLICLIGVACYTLGMIKNGRLRRRLNSELPTTTVSQFPAIRSAPGLDGPTIESFPKTVLGASRRLPNPSDGTCSICLCEYQPKEILRSIPECNHYFHAGCIDEWLKLNGTCPMCRNSPDSSSMDSTPCLSDTSLSSPSSSTTSDHPAIN